MTALLIAAALCADPRIIYTKSFPGSTPAYVEIHLERDGAVTYLEKPDDDRPVNFRLAQSEADEIFQLAGKLDHFKRPLESGLNVARMGEKTFQWVNGDERSKQSFNYSLEADARALQDWFEKITETEMHLFALERTVRFDKLGVNKALLQLEASWDKKRLLGVKQFEPLLKRVVSNESYLHMDRERAEKLLAAFQAASGDPAKASTAP
jgi:hypothetical protein